jgi:hypothetical protein
MNNKVATPIVGAIILGLLVLTTACSTNTIQAVGKYIQEFLPITEAIINIVLATESPASIATVQSIETKINVDLQEVNTLIATYNASNAVTVRQQIIALTDDVSANLNDIETAANITNPATRIVITEFVLLGDALIADIINALPPPAARLASLRNSKVKIDIAVRNYKIRFNEIISTPTGDHRVDEALSKSYRLTF